MSCLGELKSSTNSQLKSNNIIERRGNSEKASPHSGWIFPGINNYRFIPDVTSTVSAANGSDNKNKSYISSLSHGVRNDDGGIFSRENMLYFDRVNCVSNDVPLSTTIFSKFNPNTIPLATTIYDSRLNSDSDGALKDRSPMIKKGNEKECSIEENHSPTITSEAKLVSDVRLAADKVEAQVDRVLDCTPICNAGSTSVPMDTSVSWDIRSREAWVTSNETPVSQQGYYYNMLRQDADSNSETSMGDNICDDEISNTSDHTTNLTRCARLSSKTSTEVAGKELSRTPTRPKAFGTSFLRIPHQLPINACENMLWVSSSQKSLTSPSERHDGSRSFHNSRTRSPSPTSGKRLNEMVHACPRCDQRYASPSGLAKHLLVHRNDREYLCEICWQTFKKEENFNAHLATHRDNMLFVCPYADCGKRFYDMRTLTHHLESQHSSPTCGTLPASYIPTLMPFFPGCAQENIKEPSLHKDAFDWYGGKQHDHLASMVPLLSPHLKQGKRKRKSNVTEERKPRTDHLIWHDLESAARHCSSVKNPISTVDTRAKRDSLLPAYFTSDFTKPSHIWSPYYNLNHDYDRGLRELEMQIRKCNPYSNSYAQFPLSKSELPLPIEKSLSYQTVARHCEYPLSPQHSLTHDLSPNPSSVHLPWNHCYATNIDAASVNIPNNTTLHYPLSFPSNSHLRSNGLPSLTNTPLTPANPSFSFPFHPQQNGGTAEKLVVEPCKSDSKQEPVNENRDSNVISITRNPPSTSRESNEKSTEIVSDSETVCDAAVSSSSILSFSKNQNHQNTDQNPISIQNSLPHLHSKSQHKNIDHAGLHTEPTCLLQSTHPLSYPDQVSYNHVIKVDQSNHTPTFAVVPSAFSGLPLSSPSTPVVANVPENRFRRLKKCLHHTKLKSTSFHKRFSRDNYPKINIGSRYQAVIPILLEQKESHRDIHRASLMWAPLKDEEKRGNEVDAYLQVSCSLALYGGASNKEYALHILQRTRGNVKEAVRLLLSRRHILRADDPNADYHYSGSAHWTAKERFAFRHAFNRRGKAFEAIRQDVGSKSAKLCVEFYYSLKATQSYLYTSKSKIAEMDLEIEDEEIPPSPTAVVPPLSTMREPVFECDYPECHSRFVSKQALYGHIRVHGGSLQKTQEVKPAKRKPSLTSPDGEKAVGKEMNSNNSNQSESGLLHVGNISPPYFQCKVCGRIFDKVKGRSAHMKTHVRRDERNKNGQTETS